MKTILKYFLLTIVFMCLSSGMLVAGFLDVYDSVGFGIFRLLLPITLLFLLAVTINNTILIPKLLFKGKYGYYCAAVLGVIYVLNISGIWMEYSLRRSLDLPMRISNYHSPWILADILGNSLLLAMILLGLGLLRLFDRWKAETSAEQSLASRLETYIREVNQRLNLSVILAKLKRVADNVSSLPETTENGIRELSTYLREQLYELPQPPAATSDEASTPHQSRLADWLVSKKYRPIRHIIFIAILGIISCGSFFDAPDSPVFSFNRFLGVLSLFGILAFLAYINILWLYPKFLKQGNMKRYLVSVCLLLLAIVIPLIILQIVTYEPNVYTKQLPVLIAVISTLSSVLTLFLFVGGISSVLILQNWIQTSRRLTLLRAETVRQEYAWLRKQINPHFLFNVLNNIGICAYDDPSLTSRLLADLQTLLKYQLLDLRKETTTLKDEFDFIDSYFSLETTRRDNFEYILECDVPEDAEIPSLLFIPFVENAVKYSSPAAGIASVEVRFSVEDSRIIFFCKNCYNPEKLMTVKRGGLGIDNTIKRLKYLYDDNFYYCVSDENNQYTVTLKLPLI